MTSYELVKRLSTLLLQERGYANVDFIKADGSERHMKIVLDKDFIANYFKAREEKAEEEGKELVVRKATPDKCLRVIEETEDGTRCWKTIRLDRVLSVE